MQMKSTMHTLHFNVNLKIYPATSSAYLTLKIPSLEFKVEKYIKKTLSRACVSLLPEEPHTNVKKKKNPTTTVLSRTENFQI